MSLYVLSKFVDEQSKFSAEFLVERLHKGFRWRVESLGSHLWVLDDWQYEQAPSRHWNSLSWLVDNDGFEQRSGQKRGPPVTSTSTAQSGIRPSLSTNFNFSFQRRTDVSTTLKRRTYSSPCSIFIETLLLFCQSDRMAACMRFTRRVGSLSTEYLP